MKVLLYTNILTPYRKYFYDILGKCCKDNGDEFQVFVMSDSEPNRHWKYDELKTEYTTLLACKTIIKGEAYIHFNKDLKNKLVCYAPDVVICAGSYLCPGIWSVCKLKKKLKYEVYFWSESHFNESRKFSTLKLKIREWIRRKIYKKFDGFLYAGEMSKNFILRYNKDAKMFFLPNLIDEEKYQEVVSYTEEQKEIIRSNYGISSQKFTFICPARLSPVKGVLEFLELISKNQLKSKVTIVIAGDGELKEKIQAFAEENLLDVKLLGYKSQQEVIDLYAVADSFLMPSLSDPNPLTSIEALFSGLPLLVTTHVGNYPEVVLEGGNGYVIDYSKEQESIEKIETLVNSNKAWRAQAKLLSIGIARAKYNSKEKTEELLGFLKRIKC